MLNFELQPKKLYPLKNQTNDFKIKCFTFLSLISPNDFSCIFKGFNGFRVRTIGSIDSVHAQNRIVDSVV